MNKNALWRLLCEKKRQVEAARNKRAIITILFFAVVYFLLLYLNDRPAGLLEIVGEILVAIVFAAIHFLVNAAIFGQLHRVSEFERRMLDNIKKQLSEAEDNT